MAYLLKGMRKITRYFIIDIKDKHSFLQEKHDPGAGFYTKLPDIRFSKNLPKSERRKVVSEKTHYDKDSAR